MTASVTITIDMAPLLAALAELEPMLAHPAAATVVYETLGYEPSPSAVVHFGSLVDGKRTEIVAQPADELARCIRIMRAITRAA